MASIRKLSNGTYQATIFCGRDTNNKQIREYITRPSLKECKDAARELEKEIADGTYSNLQNCLFSAFSDKWLKLVENTIASSTYRDYYMYVNTHFKPFFGRKKIKDLCEFDIKEYINEKLKTLSPTTVRKHYFILNAMFRDVLKYKNPCLGIKPPISNDYTPYVPTDEEFNLLLSAVKGMFDEIIIMLAGWCGPRQGEIFCLKPDDIFDKQGMIRFDENMSIGRDGYKDKDPKSKNGKRTVIAQDTLMEALKKLKDERENQKVVNLKLFLMRPDSYSKRFSNIIKYHKELFEIKKKFGEEGLKNYLKSHNVKSIKRCIHVQNKKLPDIRFHDLRHYHTTVLYENDIPDQYVAQRLGDNIRTVKKTYQHLRLEKKKEIDNKIKNIYKNLGE
jgi:integrase